MACSCTTGLGNLGIPNCLPMNEIPVGFLFQKTYNSAGVRNSLDGASIGNASYLQDLCFNADENIRLFPLQDVDALVGARGDDKTFEETGGLIHFLKEGEKGYVGEKLVNATPKLLGKLNSMKCNDMSVYIIGHEGGLFGETTVEGTLYGYEMVSSTVSFKWVDMINEKPAFIMVNFMLADTVKDENIMKFDGAEIGDNAKRLKGIQDANGTASAISITGFTVVLKKEYGTAKTLLPLTGLVLADFLLTETSPTPGVTTITSSTETPDGTFAMLATTTAADVNVLTLSATGLAKGYFLNPVTITTP